MMKSMLARVTSLAMAVALLSTNTITCRAFAGDAGEVIDSSTFKSNYKITTIHIGSDVYEITANAFRNLINLQAITVSANNPIYASYSGCLYDKQMTELLCFPPALSGAYIPDTVVSIGEYALHGVPQDLKDSIVSVVESQALEYGPEVDVPGAHFVHDGGTVKWKCADGTIIVPNTSLMAMSAALLNDCTTMNMRRTDKLQSSFDYLTEILSYERSTEIPTGDWAEDYAEKALSTGKANCYGYAAAFAYLASGLGYESRVCVGTVTSSLGGRTLHSWTEVRLGNRWYVFDPEMQDAKGGGYYKQTYDSYPAGPLEKTGSFLVSFE